MDCVACSGNINIKGGEIDRYTDNTNHNSTLFPMIAKGKYNEFVLGSIGIQWCNVVKIIQWYKLHNSEVSQTTKYQKTQTAWHWA